MNTKLPSMEKKLADSKSQLKNLISQPATTKQQKPLAAPSRLSLNNFISTRPAQQQYASVDPTDYIELKLKQIDSLPNQEYLLNLISEFQKQCQSQSIDPFYSFYVISQVKSVSPDKAEAFLLQQLDAVQRKQSAFHKISQIILTRQKLLILLRKHLDQYAEQKVYSHITYLSSKRGFEDGEIEDPNKEIQKLKLNIVGGIKGLRLLNVSIVEEIQAWRSQFNLANTTKLHFAFYFQSKNYLLKMLTDTSFLAASGFEGLGFSLGMDPFILKPLQQRTNSPQEAELVAKLNVDQAKKQKIAQCLDVLAREKAQQLRARLTTQTSKDPAFTERAKQIRSVYSKAVNKQTSQQSLKPKIMQLVEEPDEFRKLIQLYEKDVISTIKNDASQTQLVKDRSASLSALPTKKQSSTALLAKNGQLRLAAMKFESQRLQELRSQTNAEKQRLVESLNTVNRTPSKPVISLVEQTAVDLAPIKEEENESTTKKPQQKTLLTRKRENGLQSASLGKLTSSSIFKKKPDEDVRLIQSLKPKLVVGDNRDIFKDVRPKLIGLGKTKSSIPVDSNPNQVSSKGARPSLITNQSEYLPLTQKEKEISSIYGQKRKSKPKIITPADISITESKKEAKDSLSALKTKADVVEEALGNLKQNLRKSKRKAQAKAVQPMFVTALPQKSVQDSSKQMEIAQRKRRLDMRNQDITKIYTSKMQEPVQKDTNKHSKSIASIPQHAEAPVQKKAEVSSSLTEKQLREQIKKELQAQMSQELARQKQLAIKAKAENKIDQLKSIVEKKTQELVQLRQQVNAQKQLIEREYQQETQDLRAKFEKEAQIKELRIKEEFQAKLRQLTDKYERDNLSLHYKLEKEQQMLQLQQKHLEKEREQKRKLQEELRKQQIKEEILREIEERKKQAVAKELEEQLQREAINRKILQLEMETLRKQEQRILQDIAQQNSTRLEELAQIKQQGMLINAAISDHEKMLEAERKKREQAETQRQQALIELSRKLEIQQAAGQLQLQGEGVVIEYSKNDQIKQKLKQEIMQQLLQQEARSKQQDMLWHKSQEAKLTKLQQQYKQIQEQVRKSQSQQKLKQPTTVEQGPVSQAIQVTTEGPESIQTNSNLKINQENPQNTEKLNKKSSVPSNTTTKPGQTEFAKSELDNNLTEPLSPNKQNSPTLKQQLPAEQEQILKKWKRLEPQFIQTKRKHITRNQIPEFLDAFLLKQKSEGVTPEMLSHSRDDLLAVLNRKQVDIFDSGSFGWRESDKYHLVGGVQCVGQLALRYGPLQIEIKMNMDASVAHQRKYYLSKVKFFESVGYVFQKKIEGEKYSLKILIKVPKGLGTNIVRTTNQLHLEWGIQLDGKNLLEKSQNKNCMMLPVAKKMVTHLTPDEKLLLDKYGQTDVTSKRIFRTMSYFEAHPESVEPLINSTEDKHRIMYQMNISFPIIVTDRPCYKIECKHHYQGLPTPYFEAQITRQGLVCRIIPLQSVEIFTHYDLDTYLHTFKYGTSTNTTTSVWLPVWHSEGAVRVDSFGIKPFAYKWKSLPNFDYGCIVSQPKGICSVVQPPFVFAITNSYMLQTNPKECVIYGQVVTEKDLIQTTQ